MALTFLRVERAISACRSHLDAVQILSAAASPPRLAATIATLGDPAELESYLVNYLLAIVYSEYEQHLQRTVSQRCVVATDAKLTAFTGEAARRLVGRIKISDLSGTLGHFHSDCKEKFSQQVNDPKYARNRADYDSLIANRHDLAHASGSMMTLRELEAAYPSSHFVLEAFEEAIWL